MINLIFTLFITWIFRRVQVRDMIAEAVDSIVQARQAQMMFRSSAGKAGVGTRCWDQGPKDG